MPRRFAAQPAPAQPRFEHINQAARRVGRAQASRFWFNGEVWMPDSLSPAAFWGEPTRWPALDDRFLPPPDFVWGSFTARDGAQLRWGHLPVAAARAQCVLVGGFGDFIETQVDAVRNLAAR